MEVIIPTISPGLSDLAFPLMAGIIAMFWNTPHIPCFAKIQNCK
jgi:hypothetical protein